MQRSPAADDIADDIADDMWMTYVIRTQLPAWNLSADDVEDNIVGDVCRPHVIRNIICGEGRQFRQENLGQLYFRVKEQTPLLKIRKTFMIQPIRWICEPPKYI